MFGPTATASFYSWLVLAAPLLAAFFAYRVLRETVPERLYFALVVAFGLLLLLSQFRLHYFGFFASRDRPAARARCAARRASAGIAVRCSSVRSPRY